MTADRGGMVRRFASLLDARSVLRRLADDWDEGFSSTSSSAADGGSHGSGPAHPVEVAALEPGREGAGLSARCRLLALAVDEWARQGAALAGEVRALLPLDHPVAEMLARHGAVRFIGAGSCLKCANGVSGVGEDRMKSGFCPACHGRWRRAGYPDRVRFVADASPTVGDGETAGPRSATANGVQLGATGYGLRPEPGRVA